MITLKEGDKAPAFTGVDQDGNKVTLSGLNGKKVILFFYPGDDTPTCTIQACNLRDHYGLLKKNGFKVIGISPDNEKSHKKFETKFKLPFTMIADTTHDILKKYGVWDQKKLFGHEYMGVLRTTFVIDEIGVISKIFLSPKNTVHAEEIISALKK